MCFTYSEFNFPSYSDYTKKLSRQAQSGHGRWGDERIARKGFDRDVLRAVFAQPFLRPKPDPNNPNDTNKYGVKKLRSWDSWVTPQETKEALPVRTLLAMQGHVCDAGTEGERAQILEAAKKAHAVQKRIIAFKRARARYLSGMQAARAARDAHKNEFRGGGSGDANVNEEVKKNIQEERKLKRKFARAKNDWVEKKAAAEAGAEFVETGEDGDQFE